MFIAYSILVPYLQIFSFGQNFFYAVIFVSLFIKYSHKNITYKPLWPFVFLFFSNLAIIPFQKFLPYSLQLDYLRVDLMGSLLLPFVMINVMKNDDKAFELFYKIVVFSIIIASIYSIYLITIPGINPYVMAILSLTGKEFNEAYALAEDGGRVFGRISGVFVHPMTNGLFLSLSSIFLLYQLNNKIKENSNFLFFINVTILTFVLIALFFIGVRTAIVATAIGVFVYMGLEKRIKLTAIGLLIFTILYTILSSIPEMSAFLGAIFDKDSSNVRGSSVELRLDQLNAAFRLISENYYFGNGYGWTTYYLATRGEHPTMLGFESLLIMILCNNGIIGVVFWMTVIFFYYIGVRRSLNKKAFVFSVTLFLTYFSYSMITGEYGYLKYFLIFYSLIWIQGYKLSRNFNREVLAKPFVRHVIYQYSV